MNGCGRVPVKLYLLNRGWAGFGPQAHSLPTLVLGLKKIHKEIRMKGRKNGKNGKVLKVALVNKMHAIF